MNTIAISSDDGPKVAPALVVCGFPGVPAANQKVILTCPGVGSLPNGLTFPGNFTNSTGLCITLPTATATFTLYKIPAGSTTPVAFGTVIISTAGVFTFATTSGLPEAFAAGDGLMVVAPGTPDATLADLEFTLAGTR